MALADGTVSGRDGFSRQVFRPRTKVDRKGLEEKNCSFIVIDFFFLEKRIAVD